MKTATLIKEQTSEAGAEQRVYRLNPPHVEEHYDGTKTTHEIVVVSGVHAFFSGPETYIFPSTEDGEVTDWGELTGSFRGAINHEQALRGMGYEIFNGEIIDGEVVMGEVES